MNGLGDPIPLGDAVSEGRISETRVMPNFDDDSFQCNTLHGVHGSGKLPCPSPKPNPYPSGFMPANPNRVTGRRGGKSGTNSSRPNPSQIFSVTQEYSHHSVQREVTKGSLSSRNTPNKYS